MKSGNTRIFQFKISLNNFKPQIWRRILVPSSYSFWDLHVAIQDSMGWEDDHLHTFLINDPDLNNPVRTYIPIDGFLLENGNELDEQEVIISDYFNKDNTIAKYVYDFGDNWEHTVKFEKILELDSSEKIPRCIAGKRACPPEDCGGVYGYYHLLSVIKEPNHIEYDDIMDWLEEDFDPEVFEPDSVIFYNPAERLKRFE